MTLANIETAIRPQFTWQKEPNKRWHVTNRANDNQSLETTMGLIVFCGTAAQMGFLPKDTIDFLEIKREKYYTYLMQYKKAHNLHSASLISALFSDDTTFDQRVMAKAHIVINAIKLQQPTTYITLADFNY